MGVISYEQAYYISKQTYDKFMTRGFSQKEDIHLTTEAPLGCVAKPDRNGTAVTQILEKQISLLVQIQDLSAIRDVLLPKLLLGKVHLPAASVAEFATQAGIPEAEKMIKNLYKNGGNNGKS